MSQPEPIAIRWAPPPMLVEVPPPSPSPGSVWIGGYWTWNGTWVWAHGHWAQPPRPGYYWVHPYYENRYDEVVFVTGYWSPPQAVFMPPPLTVHIAMAWVAPNVVPGPRPIGPSGVFVPAPPGSRAGIIVPAPVGTPPAVVTSAPPVVNVGMHIEHNVDVHNRTINNAVTNNISNVHNVTNITNVTNVTIVAPPGVVANGQAVKSVVPAQAHLAAALPAVVNMPAPKPATNKFILSAAAAHPPAPIMATPHAAPDAHVQHFETPYHGIMAVPASATAPARPDPVLQEKLLKSNASSQFVATNARQYASKPLALPESMAAPHHSMDTHEKIDATPSHWHSRAKVPPIRHGEEMQKPHSVVDAQRPNRTGRHEQTEPTMNQHKEKGKEVPVS